MTYAVKEIFYTLQGEGAQAGRAAVFLRFAGCNLWSGRVEDRGRGPGACSAWCDTHFVGTEAGRFATASDLAVAVKAAWVGTGSRPFVVCTGGEPLLQLDAAAVSELHAAGFEVAVETNGTRPIPAGIDWLCVSPKAGVQLVVTRGDELKLVYPHGLDPAEFAGLDFAHHFLQPLDSPYTGNEASTSACIEYCLAHPRWRLSVQLHKRIGVR